MKTKNWTIEQETGYKPLTTFYLDFSIADAFGESAIRDTYKRAFEGWKTNCKYITELVMVLNWKCWEHYNTKNILISELYGKLYYELDEWCLNNLKEDDLSYYIHTTD